MITGHRRRVYTEAMAKVVASVCGTELIPCRTTDLASGWFEQTWQSTVVAAEHLDDLPVLTIPNHHPSKMDVLLKTFLQIIRAAKWPVRHSSTSQNSSDDLCLLFCINPSSTVYVARSQYRISLPHVLYRVIHTIHTVSYITNEAVYWKELNKIVFNFFKAKKYALQPAVLLNWILS